MFIIFWQKKLFQKHLVYSSEIQGFKAVKYKKDIILEIVFFVSSFHCFTKMKENDRNNKVNYLLFQVFMPTFVPDMKKLLYIIVIILFSVTCSRNETNERLIEVDSLVMHQQYDSADVILSKIDTTLLKDGETKAHYYLLWTQLTSVLRGTDSITMLDSLVIPYYKKINNQEKLADAYYYKANGEYSKGRLPEATSYYKLAEALALNTSNAVLQYKVAEGLTFINSISGKYHLQLEYGKRCIKISKTLDNKCWLAYSYLNVAMAHFNLNHKDSFNVYINKAAQLITYIVDKDKYAFLANLAYSYKHSQPEKAKSYYQEALNLKESSVIMEHLADIYYNEGNQEEAYRMWKRALATKDDNPKDNIVHNLLEYDIEHGKTDNVCQQINEIIAIKDSIISSLKNDTIKDLQLRFDHKVAMFKQEQKMSNWQKGLLAAMLLLTLLIAYIIINRYREKDKLQKTQIRINNLMTKIQELEASGEQDSETIIKLKEQLKFAIDKEGKKLKEGMALYYKIVNGETAASWNRKEINLFIDYYTAIDYMKVKQLKDTKRKERISPYQLFFLILREMGYSKKRIAEILNIKETSVNTLISRTKPIE